MILSKQLQADLDDENLNDDSDWMTWVRSPAK